MNKKSDTSANGTVKDRETRDATPAVKHMEVAESPWRFDPLRLADWFDHWPEIFARRWPESLQGMPWVEGGFKMEQSVGDDALVIRGELPGLDPDKDVTITVDGDYLVISGEREDRNEDKTDGRVRSEFHYGSFERSVRLPSGARTAEIEASYTNGILEVKVPIDSKASQTTTIPIARHT